MKKIFNLILASSVALGFAACNNDKAPQVENANEGTTYAGMYISGEKSIAPRAISQEDNSGIETEGKLSTLDLLSTASSKSWNLGTTPDVEGTFWQTTTAGVYTVAPWKTTAGDQTMALIANKGTMTLPAIGAADSYAFGSTSTAKEDIKGLSSDNSFVMTSMRKTQTVADDKSVEDVKDGTDDTNNVFKFDLERVVVQGKVAKAETLKAETKDGKGDIDLDQLTYAAVNGAAKSYLFANNAGERKMADADTYYKDYKSVIDDYTEFQNAKKPEDVADKLIRLGSLLASGQTSNEDLGNYKAIDVFADADAAKAARGIYFLENSVDKAKFTPENKNFGFYRMAYAKVYAVYTPKQVSYWDNETSTMKTKKIDAGTTFYKGVKDNILYADKDSAKKSTIAKDQEAYTYTDGKCAYRALWNRQMDPTNDKLVKNADVRRNNIYLLTITEFQGIGMPWDPSDPNDPNLPKPGDDPNDDPDNPDIEESETYMRVEATVLPWNLVSRNISLK